MFAAIKTNGANVIVIYIPADGADKSLPQLAKMLEQNTTCIQEGYREASIKKPEMTIHLGDKFLLDGNEEVIQIVTPGVVVDEHFEIATPEVFISHKAALTKAEIENTRIRAELSFVKSELSRLQDQIKALTETSEG